TLSRRLTAAASMVAILALVGVGWRFAGVSRSSPFGTTTGEIIVGSPEVYSRERLVNDRFQQTTWLEQQLRLTDKQDWGPEAVVQSRKGDFVSLAAGVRADPHAEEMIHSTAAAGNVGGAPARPTAGRPRRARRRAAAVPDRPVPRQ